MIGIMGVPFLRGYTYPKAVKAKRSFNFFLNYCKTLIHVMQLTKGSSHYTTMSAINLHRWPILKTTGINIETHQLILNYCKLSDQLSKLHFIRMVLSKETES